MKETQFTREDKWINLFVSIFVSLVLNTFLLGNRYCSDIKTFLLASLVLQLIWFFVIKIFTRIALAIRNRFSNYGQAFQRILMEAGLFIVLTVLIQLGVVWIFETIGFLEYTLSWERVKLALVFGAVSNILTTCIYEGKYIFEQWEERVKENEKLKKTQLQQRLESLKTQVNPHFLFNSLTSLSALIGDNPEQAELFLDQMAKVYRYMLRSSTNEWVPLSVELDFLNSYFYLLQSRYGEGITYSLLVSQDVNTALLMPLTLQSVIDVALKKNVISKEQPLMFYVETHERDLIIRYNLQPKKRKVLDEDQELSALIAKYELTGKASVAIKTTENECVVTLPLMGVNHENINY
ncbi:histidine kinase [Cytophagaceae bacterium YF14B1]|uniref:Histidine kinase n=1 Tax=Xanthocytophaga flava TaxID=3048013 RepID=A0AAE3QPS7_9BACT|nr:histidine kinase [Xanthocytophaga flavus]MDJ1483237.1 histidine kinase [Xanthocytophaga flavus]